VACLFNDGGIGGSATTLNPTSIHRSTRIHANDPGLANKDLSRKYLMAKGCPEFWKMLTYPAVGTQAPTTGWTPVPVSTAVPLTGFGYTTGSSVSGGGGGGAGGAGGGAGGGGGY
jgi:hypothetical protein